MNALIHELHQILIGGDNGDIPALFFSLAGQRGNHIIGLEVVDTKQRQVECLGDLPYTRPLHGQVFGHRRPVRLVFGICLVSKGSALWVEGNSDMRRLQFFQYTPEHLHITVNGICRIALAVRQLADGVISAVNVIRPVD